MVLRNDRLVCTYKAVSGTGTPTAHLQGFDGRITLGNQFQSNGLVDEMEEGFGGGVNDEKTALNRLIRARGGLYWLVAGRIYKYRATDTSTAGTWDLELDLTLYEADAQSSNNIGIYSITHQSIPYICTAFQQGATDSWVGVRKNLVTNVWQSGSPKSIFTATSTNGAILNEIQYKNKIYFINNNPSDGIGVFNMRTLNLSKVSWSSAGTIRNPIDFCVFGGILWALARDSSGNNGIYRITSGAFRELILSGGPAPIGNNLFNRNFLYVDNEFPESDRMYAIYEFENDKPTDRWVLSELVFDGKTLTENRRLDDQLFHTVRSAGNDDYPQQVDDILRGYVDQAAKISDDDSLWQDGNNRQAIMMQIRNDTGDFRDWEEEIWRGPDFPGPENSWRTNCFFRSSGPDICALIPPPEEGQTHLSYNHEKNGNSSARFWPHTGTFNNPNQDIWLSGVQGLPNEKVRLFYGIETSETIPNGTEMSVRIFFNASGHAPNLPCSLENPSEGTIFSPNIIDGIISDSGTTYSVDWDSGSQGLPFGFETNILMVVATTGV